MKDFFKWLQNPGSRISQKKKTEFERIKKVWDLSKFSEIPQPQESEQEWLKLQSAIRIEENKIEKRKLIGYFPVFLRPKLVFAFLTIMIIAAAFSYYFYQTQLPVVYQTANQEKISVILSDGSVVQLNAASKLSVPKQFNDSERTVYLQGEVYFEVKKGSFPFIVKTDPGQVKVIGTAFNVNTRDETMRVDVQSGTVQLTSTASSHDSSIFLSKGYFSSIKKGDYPLSPEVIHFEHFPDWVYNKLNLQGKELKFIFEEIERRFDTAIIPQDTSVIHVKISGTFNAGNLDSLMSSICLLINKKYKTENESIIIYE